MLGISRVQGVRAIFTSCNSYRSASRQIAFCHQNDLHLPRHMHSVIRTRLCTHRPQLQSRNLQAVSQTARSRLCHMYCQLAVHRLAAILLPRTSRQATANAGAKGKQPQLPALHKARMRTLRSIMTGLPANSLHSTLAALSYSSSPAFACAQ